MPLNGTDREKVQTAADEFAKKIKLERRMKRQLNELYRIISSDFAAFYAATGSTLDANNYSDDVRGIVSSQYRRTTRAFSKSLVRFLRKNKNSTTEPIIQDLQKLAKSQGIPIEDLIANIENNITRNLEAFTRTNVINNVDSVVRTIQKDMDRSVVKSRRLLTDELERDPTRRELSRTSSSMFQQRSLSRVGTQAATTTQNAAEGTKQIERDNFLSTVNSVEARQAEVTPRKHEDVWITMGDSLVRDGSQGFDHLSADFQVKQDGVFTVSGQLLRFPSDRSLGASDGNVINCRCSAVTTIE